MVDMNPRARQACETIFYLLLSLRHEHMSGPEHVAQTLYLFSSPLRANSPCLPLTSHLLLHGRDFHRLRFLPLFFLYHQDDRPFKMTRRVQKTRNPLEFFHVCPLLLHDKLCDGNGRPVHRLVFACPGKAAAMVSHHTSVMIILVDNASVFLCCCVCLSSHLVCTCFELAGYPGLTRRCAGRKSGGGFSPFSTFLVRFLPYNSLYRERGSAVSSPRWPRSRRCLPRPYTRSTARHIVRNKSHIG